MVMCLCTYSKNFRAGVRIELKTFLSRDLFFIFYLANILVEKYAKWTGPKLKICSDKKIRMGTLFYSLDG